MRCSHCHEPVDFQWKFCPHCGRTLVDEKIIAWFLNTLRLRKVAYGLLIFEIVFIGVLAYLLVNSSEKLHKKDEQLQQLMNTKKDVSVQWNVKDKIFPLSYVGDNQKLVEFKVSSAAYDKIKAEVSVDGLTSIEAKIVDLKPGGNIFYLGPEITAEGYKKLADSTKATVNIKVTTLGEEPKEIVNDKKEIFFYSVNDLAWYDADGTSNAKYVVRLVNKDKNDIKELVRLAADHMKEVGAASNSMVGQLGSQEEISQQLQAIFLAIAKDSQVRFVMAPYSYDSVDVQKIKSPSEVLATKSGLCIELSLLVAAALENVGLNPVIVTTSDHAWPGVQLDAAKDDYVFIESTLLDGSISEALKIGQSNWDQVKNTPGAYKLLKFRQLRSEGLLPIKN